MAQRKTTKELKHSASKKSGYFSVRGQSRSGSVSQESEDYQTVSSKVVPSVIRKWEIETPTAEPLCESQCESVSATDMCSLCAGRGQGTKATHICRDCSQYGRYFCKICWYYHNQFNSGHDTLSLSVSSDSNQGASVKSLRAASNGDDDIKMWLNELKQQIEKDEYNARAFEKKPNGNVESEHISVILKDICKIIQKKCLSQRDLLSKVETLYSKLQKACDDLQADSSETSTPLVVQGAAARKQESLEERKLSSAIVNAEKLIQKVSAKCETKDKRAEDRKQTQKILKMVEQHWKSNETKDKRAEDRKQTQKILKMVEQHWKSNETKDKRAEDRKQTQKILKMVEQHWKSNETKDKRADEQKQTQEQHWKSKFSDVIYRLNKFLKQVSESKYTEELFPMSKTKEGSHDEVNKCNDIILDCCRMLKKENDCNMRTNKEVKCLLKEINDWNDVETITEAKQNCQDKVVKEFREGRLQLHKWKNDFKSIETEVNSLLEEIYAWDDTKLPIEAKGNTCKVVEALRDCRLKLRDRKLDFKSGRNKASVACKEKQSQDQVIKEMWTMIRPTSGKVKLGEDETGKALTESKKYVSDAQRLSADFNELSKDCGARLVDNNPNIADLSNPYRPTKIAEQFSELYDNHWKDAFQTLKNKDQENTAYLLKIIVDCFEICWKISKNHQRNLKSAVCCPGENIASGQASKQKRGKMENPVSFSAVQSKTLSELRKQTADISVDGVISQIESAKKEWFVSKALGSYTTRCIELCWLMHVQTPPVVIDTCAKSGSNFDTSRYKQYTKAGKKIDFIVWPVLLLEEGGAVLCKGVAQGK